MPAMNDQTSITFLQLALDLAAKGLPVFPCNPANKRPYTDHGFKDASTDPANVQAFWTQHPRALIGIPTGRDSGIFALDLDKDDDTGEALGEAWLARVGLAELLEGPGATTPSGGRHIYFRADGLADGLRNTTSKPLGVDTRGDGGYIIAPGSIASKGAYRAANGGLDGPNLPTMPEALLEALQAIKGKPSAATSFQIGTGYSAGGTASADLAEVQEVLRYIPPDGSYDDWVEVLMGLHEHFAGSGEGLAVAEAWSAPYPHYKRGEVAAKWRGFEAGGGKSWSTVCHLARQNGADLSDIARRHRGRPNGEHSTLPAPSATSQTWPDPEARYLRPELPDPPALPLAEVFGPIWGPWIAKAAEAKAAPPDYVAAALLAVSGALIGNTRWVSPWTGWTEPPILWAMTIGTPSMNKSPSFDAVLGPLKKLEREARRAEVAKLAESAWKEAARAALKDDKEPPAKPSKANPGPEPVRPRYALTDATVEKLGVILAGQPRGALVFRDELPGWLQGMTRYSGGGSDRPFWLEAYGGRGFSVERLGRDPVYIDFLSVGVLGGIQPDRLKTLLFKSDDDGLLARFLPIWPRPAPIKRPTAGADEAFLSSAFERLLALQMPLTEEGHPRPWYVPFTEDAAALFQDYRETVRDWETGAEGLLLSYMGKLPGIAARLSLILAFLDYAATGRDTPQSIPLEAFGRAAHFVEAYALPMARRAYADASVPKPERAARRLASIITEKRLDRFSSREILQMERDGLRTKAELDPALVLLEEANIIRRLDAQPGPKGGAPTRAFVVNPGLWGRK